MSSPCQMSTPTQLNPDLKSSRALQFEHRLQAMVIGQERVVRSISSLYQVFHAGMTDPSRPGEISSIARAHPDRAAATLRALDVPVQISIRTSESPSEGILGEAREAGHDLIVVGGHDVQSGDLFSLDDVTSQVLRGADRPVLVVPTEQS